MEHIHSKYGKVKFSGFFKVDIWAQFFVLVTKNKSSAQQFRSDASATLYSNGNIVSFISSQMERIMWYSSKSLIFRFGKMGQFQKLANVFGE